MEELSTEQVARALDAWRARRRGTPTPEPPVEPRARRIWLTDAATQARRREVSPGADPRDGGGSPAWEAGAPPPTAPCRAPDPGPRSPLGAPSDERQAVMDAMAKAIADELGVDDFEDAWDIAPRPWDPASPPAAETSPR